MSCVSPFLRAKVISLSRLLMTRIASQQEIALPFIAKIWPFIVKRLHDEKHFVILEALEFFDTVSWIAKDFVSRSTKDDLLPLFEQLSKSYLKQNSHTSVDIRVQRKSFETLAELIKNKCVRAYFGAQLATIVFPFLDALQDSTIQKSALEVLIAFVDHVDKDSIWVYCQPYLGVSTLSAPTSFCKTIQVPKWMVKSNEFISRYKKNVDTLMQKIDSTLV